MVTVTGHAIGLEVVGRFREQRAHFRLAAGARHARLAVGDQGLGIDQRLAAFQQRRQAQQHGGGIAAGVADDARAGDGFAVQFHQAVLGFGQDVRADGNRRPGR
ncbi:hypothetical protein G6F31_020361 [Rhizopus arrhizus]|nr:hypothetical protein G6F31_020361 [Rhizopus arrhizus]